MKYDFEAVVEAVTGLKPKVQVKFTKKDVEELMGLSRGSPRLEALMVRVLSKRTDVNINYQKNYRPSEEPKSEYVDYRKELVKKQTKSEKKFKALLKSLKVEYKFQQVFRGEGQMRIVDFFLPDYNYVIEVDGGYHTTELQKQKDKDRTAFLKYMGVKKVIRFTNEEVYNTDKCIKRIKKELKL